MSTSGPPPTETGKYISSVISCAGVESAVLSALSEEAAEVSADEVSAEAVFVVVSEEAVSADDVSAQPVMLTAKMPAITSASLFD